MKRILCMLLVVVMLLTCAACSNKNDSSPNKPDNASENEFENTENNQHNNDDQNDDETDDHANEGDGWYLEDKEINGWKFRVIHDPDWEFEYDVPEAEFQDTTVTIAGETKTVNMLQSPFNCGYDELVAKMKAINFIDEYTKLYPYEMEKIRYYDEWNKCDNKFVRGFKVKETGRDVMVQTGEFGVNGTNKICVTFTDDDEDVITAISQDYAYEVLKELVGEKLAAIAVYYSEEDDIESEDLEDQMSADHDPDCDGYNYEIEREISVDGDGRVWCAEFSVSIEAFTFDDDLEALWQEYTKEETCDTKYADTKHNCFKILGIPFESPMGDTNMKEYFAHCHDGSIGTQLESFDYTHALQWNRYNNPDESYYNMYCTYTNLADNDNYARPYLQLSYSAFDDENGTPTYVSLSANGWFDAFQATSTELESEAWNAERDAAYQELCETGSKTLSMLLKTDVTLNLNDFTMNENQASIELKVNSNVLGEDYEYTVKVNLNYTNDPYQDGVYYWCGDLFVA